MMKTKNKGGRPPMFNAPEEMAEKIDEYFYYIGKDEKPVNHLDDTPTITGLIYYIGFADRKSFYEYEKKEEFTHIIKRSKTIVENWYEKSLMKGNATGSIFALKNMGWRDKPEVEVSGDKEETEFTIVLKRD